MQEDDDYFFLKRIINNRNESDNKRKTDKLKNILITKLKTSFIGAIARFEEFFGELWGHGKHFSELSEKQKEFRKIWEDCRNSILTNGNNQIRGIESELDNTYSYNFKRGS